MMDFTKASFCVLLVLLTTAVSLKDTEDKQEDFLSQLLDPASGLLDEDTAKLLWTICSINLIHLKEEVGYIDLCFQQESSSCINEISSEAQSLARENIQKLINDCHPQLKQLFLHCLRKNNHPLRVFRDEDDSNVWHATYIKSLFARSNVPRRNLGRRLPERKLKVTNTVPAVKSSLLPASSPKKDTKSQSPTTKKASSNAKGSAKKKKDDKKTLVIVIAAVVTFVVALLLSICCCCCCRCCRKSRAKKNDERPLLSMSDYSVGSSNSARGNSTRGEKFNNLADHKNISSLNGNFSVGSDVPESQSPGAAARSSFDLKPPPGRVATIAAQLSPLKPPPGRPNVLPPQPHSGNAAAAPPPPPPPAPPQPGKPHTGPPPPPPPAPPGAKAGARAPPPPKGGLAPPRPPPPIGAKVARPLAISKLKAPEGDADSEGDADAPKAKLKPFFWDKVQANSDQSMVWNQIKSGSFQFDEEMMETLFGYSSVDKTKVEHKKKSSSLDPAPQYIQIIEAKKSQNLSILLKALNVTMEEVCDALHEGNELPSEFIQTLLKMAPTPDEELKLRLFNGKLSQLGPADRFLKALVEIPIAFKRLEALLFMGTLKEELTSTKESFAILEVASKELRSSRLFLKLLEAVLKTGNRMNDGTFRGGAHAFKLDTLLKLSDVKGIDGKTTLLHFVVKEIIRSEGIRAARISKESRSFSSIMTDDLLEDISIETEERYHELGLQVVSHLSSELENVKKAAALDADSLTGTTAKLGHGLMKTRDLLKRDLESQEADRGFYHTVESFVQNAEDDVTNLLEEEKKIMDLVKSTGDYFHGNTGRDEGLRLFIIVRDFLIMLDKVCKEVGDAQKKAARTPKQETAPRSSISDLRPPPSPDHRKQLFPAIIERRTDDFSSDDESP